MNVYIHVSMRDTKSQKERTIGGSLLGFAVVGLLTGGAALPVLALGAAAGAVAGGIHDDANPKYACEKLKIKRANMERPLLNLIDGDIDGAEIDLSNLSHAAIESLIGNWANELINSGFSLHKISWKKS